MPRTALLFADIVSVELPEPLTLAGLNVELVRFGNPLTEKVTEDEKGPIAVTVTV